MRAAAVFRVFGLAAAIVLLHVPSALLQAADGGVAGPRLVLSGEVRAADAQAIVTPPSDSSPVVLRHYVPDGTRVAPGDVVLRIDPGQSSTQVQLLAAQIAQARARADKESAELAVKAIDAERLLADADAALAKARIDAAVPRAHRSALDYDRFQGELERATREAALKQREFVAAEAAVARRREDGALEVDKLVVEQRYHEDQIAVAEVRAERAGIVVHGFDPWRGGRYDEGSSVQPGRRVGEVVDEGGRAEVRAWALEPERARLAADQTATLYFDALPGVTVRGSLLRIAGAPESKAEWGAARWFAIDVALSERAPAIKPGMSVRVEVDAAAPPPVPAPAPAARYPLALDGEVFARDTSAIAPPAIHDLWQFNLTQLAPDGMPVKQGEVVATFDGGELQKRLGEKRSALAEKVTQRDKLALELTERERSERLLTAEQRSKLEKAQRKAAQPAGLLARADYDKLVVERAQAQRQMLLVERREALAARQRGAERALVQAEFDQLEREVKTLDQALQQLAVKAPRDGVMLHLTTWQGEKFDVGSQVWRGQSVAQVPDLATLAVRAQIPERELTRVTVGAQARVRIDGGAGAPIAAHIVEVGRVVRSRSRVQPVPVLDAVVALQGSGWKLKPGQTVRVEVLDAGPAAASAAAAGASR